ncbi:uncharacterized protein EV420DRAFT_1552262 [Desarmillaria tabescens]|uniref:F-box domain-containing protein n=1 Tax=Armillaria tabescens TaxID=1929756 RepID=A0AA39K7A2_ARMTA|nr:uncharacterized protein EV420DRAFT_1552262 [Desarmillaria tabescens]KAK0455618.1 hypothetical protein EV420DRAFT_1552262 [Desarmillaria tabescens]
MTEPIRRSSRIKVPSKRKSLAESSFQAEEWQSEDQGSGSESEFEGLSQRSKLSPIPGRADEEWKGESEEDDGGNFEDSPQKLKCIPAKRMRRNSRTARVIKPSKEAPDKGKAKQKKRRQRDLSLLPTMPLDVLFTICSMLTSRDLINLSRVDANFCRTLIANNVSFVWKAVREGEGGIEPPRDIPEYRWVDLLFGVSACDVCDARHVRVDWMLRRRICKRCLKPNLIYGPRVAKLFPGADAEVLSLIPHTNSGITTSSSGSRFYWSPDIDEIMDKLDHLKSDRSPGSSERLSRFIEERKDFVTETLKIVLLELGYTEDDMAAIRWCNSVRKNAKLTSSGWKKMLPGLKDTIAHHRDQIAKAEYSRALQQRIDILRSLYTSYQRDFNPSVWRQMPPLMDVCMFSAFKNLLESPTKDQITESSFSHAMGELPNLIAAWHQDRTTHVRNLAAAGLAGQVDTTVDATTLAICVFGCSNKCHNYSGTYADLWRHRCPPRRSYIYWDFSFQNVEKFYECRGNGDIKEMDSLEDCFPFRIHGIHGGDIIYGRPLLTWRQCVSIASLCQAFVSLFS